MAKSKQKGKRGGGSPHKNKDSKNIENQKKVKEVETQVKKAEEKEVPKTSMLVGSKNKLASFLIILMGVLTIVFIGAFFMKKFLEPIDVAGVLPVGETVMMVSFDVSEITWRKNSDMDATADKKLPLENLKNILEEALNANFAEDINPWLGEEHGYALLKVRGEDGGDRYEHVLFVQSIDKDATLKFLADFKLESLKDGLTEEEYSNHSIYSFAVGQNVSFLLLDKYFVFARNAEVLKKIVDVKIGAAGALSADDNFLTVRNSLKKDAGFIYYAPAALFDYYLAEPTSGMAFVRPILSLFTGVGHSVIFDDQALVVQTYINFNTELGDMRLPGLGTHYKGNLQNVMPDGFEYFWGSRDLSKILLEFGAVLNQLHPSSFNILEGALNAKKEQYFGYEVDLREDIYRVFENEFALGLYPAPDHIDYLFVAENQDQDHIYKLQAYYMAAMQERGFEVLEANVPSEEGAGMRDQISVFPFDGRTNMYTAMHEGTFVMSTAENLVEETLTRIDGGGEDTQETLTINSYLKDFDEVNIASTAFMSELLGDEWSAYLSGFNQIQAAKSIFPSGMVLVHVFE